MVTFRGFYSFSFSEWCFWTFLLLSLLQAFDLDLKMTFLKKNYFLNYNFVLLGLSFLLKPLEIYFWWSIPWEVWRAVVAIIIVSSTDIFVVQLIIFAKPCIKVELKQHVFIFMTKNVMLKKYYTRFTFLYCKTPIYVINKLSLVFFWCDILFVSVCLNTQRYRTVFYVLNAFQLAHPGI